MAVGHSLGEYTALYASGVISFEEAIRTVTQRGQLMNQPEKNTMPERNGIPARPPGGHRILIAKLRRVRGSREHQ